MHDDNRVDPLPGLMPRTKWAAALGLCDRTAKRMQDAGKLVVHYVGRVPHVDIAATAARIRGEDRKHRGRGA